MQWTNIQSISGQRSRFIKDLCDSYLAMIHSGLVGL